MLRKSIFIVIALVAALISGCGGGGGGNRGTGTLSSSTGNIEGYVYEPVGAARATGRLVVARSANAAPAGYQPLTGATVQSAGRTTTTDANGYFLLTAVAVGTQTVTISKTGYQTIQIIVVVIANITIAAAPDGATTGALSPAAVSNQSLVTIQRTANTCPFDPASGEGEGPAQSSLSYRTVGGEAYGTLDNSLFFPTGTAAAGNISMTYGMGADTIDGCAMTGTGTISATVSNGQITGGTFSWNFTLDGSAACGSMTSCSITHSISSGQASPITAVITDYEDLGVVRTDSSGNWKGYSITMDYDNPTSSQVIIGMEVYYSDSSNAVHRYEGTIPSMSLPYQSSQTAGAGSGSAQFSSAIPIPGDATDVFLSAYIIDGTDQYPEMADMVRVGDAVEQSEDTSDDDADDGAGDTVLIPFVSTKDGFNSIYTMNDDGTNVTKVVQGTSMSLAQYPLIVGSNLVYTPLDYNGSYWSMGAVYGVGLDGTNKQTLVASDGGEPGGYDASTKFIYADPETFNLYSFNIATMQKSLLWSNNTSYSVIEFPVMHTSGKIIVEVLNGGSRRLGVIDLATSQLTLISGADLAGGGIAVTPSGKIVYAETSGSTRQLFSINIDGTGKTQLTTGAESAISPYALSNGKIAYQYQDSANSNCEVYVMNEDGSSKTNLTNTPTYDEVIGEGLFRSSSTATPPYYTYIVDSCF
jgi:hypothetical protein